MGEGFLLIKEKQTLQLSYKTMGNRKWKSFTHMFAANSLHIEDSFSRNDASFIQEKK